MTLAEQLDFAKTIAAFLTPIVTFFGFFFLSSQLKLAQATYNATTEKQKNDLGWRRAEYLDGKIQKQFSDRTIKTVLQMLDYGDRSYVLERGADNGEPLLIRVFHRESDLQIEAAQDPLSISLEQALDSNNQNHTNQKIIIREMFDELFSHFESLERLLEAELLSRDELEPYYRYYIDRLANDNVLSSIVKNYTTTYGFRRAENFLFKRFSSPASNPRTA